MFKFEGDKFRSVEECQSDENNTLSSTAIGGALIILIVLIAFLTGRNESHAGHQTIEHGKLLSTIVHQ